MEHQKLQSAVEKSIKQRRILFFDLIRILCIAIIVYDRARFDLITPFNQFFFPDGYGPFSIYTNGLQGYAVFGMIFVSGAVLEYNYTGIGNLTEYFRFLFRRFIRLYPAFWMSLIFCLVLFPVIWQDHLPGVLFEFTGFFVILGQGAGILNPMGWFIAAIVSLYILFPWFSKVIRKYGPGSLLGFLLISWGLRSLIMTCNPGVPELFWRWFPLCNAFEFCLGIYIVRNGWFPKKENISPLARSLSDLSYYVFLFHIAVLWLFLFYLVSPLVQFDYLLAPENAVLFATIFYCQRALAIIFISWIVMKTDTRLRTWLLRQDAIRVFLKAS